METQDTDQDSTVLHPGSSARNVRNTDISPASASQKPQSTNVNTIEEVNAVFAFTKSPHSVQAELSDDDSWMQCTYAQ